MRLKLTQQAIESIEIKRTKSVDLLTGKQVTVESPNLRKTTLTVDLDVDDGEPILMPVAYQTPEAKAKGRVLALLNHRAVI